MILVDRIGVCYVIKRSQFFLLPFIIYIKVSLLHLALQSTKFRKGSKRFFKDIEIVVDPLYYTQQYNFVGVLIRIEGILWKSDTCERDCERDRIRRYDETYTWLLLQDECRAGEGNESPCGR